MTLKPLVKGLAIMNGLNVEQQLELLKQRQEDIKLNGFFTAFVMDKIRQDESNACKKQEWQEENKKLRGEE